MDITTSSKFKMNLGYIIDTFLIINILNYCNGLICNYTDPEVSPIQDRTPTRNIWGDNQPVKLSCTMLLSEKKSGKKALNFTCSWEKECFDVNAAIDISHLERHPNKKCSSNGNSVTGGPFLPNVFLNGTTEAEAVCALTMPNEKPRPTCNFSLYITPRISTIRVGETINLTCPHNASRITWWEIRGKQVKWLNSTISGVSQAVVTFSAETLNEDGFIIMCKGGSEGGKGEAVLGIGKVIVKECSTRDDPGTIDWWTDIFPTSLGLAFLLTITICLLLILYSALKKKLKIRTLRKHLHGNVNVQTCGQDISFDVTETQTSQDGPTTSQIINITNIYTSCKGENVYSDDPFEDIYHNIDESVIVQECTSSEDGIANLSFGSPCSPSVSPTHSGRNTDLPVPGSGVNQAATAYTVHHEYFSRDDFEGQ